MTYFVTLTILACLLLWWAILKSWALLNSVRWASGRGADFTIALQRRRLSDLRSQLELLAQYGADFLPFGAKSYRIRNVFLARENGAYGTVWRILGTASNMFVNSAGFMGTCVLFIIVTNITLPQGAPALGVLIVIVATWLVLYTIGLAVEAIAWYMAVGSYAGPFFLLGSTRRMVRNMERAKARELWVFFALAFFALANLSLLVSTVQLRYGGFGGLSAEAGVAGEFERLVDSTYFVLSNLITIGSSEIVPVSSLARFAVGLVHVSTLFLVTFTLTLLLASIGQPEGGHGRSPGNGRRWVGRGATSSRSRGVRIGPR
jgi:hypothetical protein